MVVSLLGLGSPRGRPCSVKNLSQFSADANEAKVN